ncbi:MAG: hypothetical protein VX239_03350 [Candidatus Thermoplasmatota archaeon]|nr:hypothetical protein [Candidatus Thermoplasmatota archaeon]
MRFGSRLREKGAGGWTSGASPETQRPSARALAMSRKRTRPSSEETEQSYEDIIGAAAKEDVKYGVVWDYFIRGAEREHRQNASRSIKQLVEEPAVQTYYVGVCRCPAHRFFETPSPHRERFDAMYPLMVGKNMGKVERNMIVVLRTGEVALHKIKNVGPGGERVRARGVRFLYLCVNRKSPTRAASPETEDE